MGVAVGVRVGSGVQVWIGVGESVCVGVGGAVLEGAIVGTGVEVSFTVTIVGDRFTAATVGTVVRPTLHPATTITMLANAMLLNQ